MDLISNAERALVRNWRVVLAYTATCAVAAGMYSFILNQLNMAVPEATSPKPVWYLTVYLLAQIAYAAVASVLQAIAFARLGADIDKPLWKCASDREALGRFFKIWFIINLSLFALFRLCDTLYDAGMSDVAVGLYLMTIGWSCFCVPVGICLMHNGGAKQLDVPNALAPLIYLLPQFMLVAFLGLLQYIIAVLLAGLAHDEVIQKSPLFQAGVTAPSTVLECLIVSMVWFLCMRHRVTAAERENDNDFDF